MYQLHVLSGHVLDCDLPSDGMQSYCAVKGGVDSDERPLSSFSFKYASSSGHKELIASPS